MPLRGMMPEDCDARDYSMHDIKSIRDNPEPSTPAEAARLEPQAGVLTVLDDNEEKRSSHEAAQMRRTLRQGNRRRRKRR